LTVDIVSSLAVQGPRSAETARSLIAPIPGNQRCCGLSHD
jgi:hypothetical protein